MYSEQKGKQEMKKWYSIIMVLSLFLLMGFGIYNWQAQSRSSDAAHENKNQIIKSISPREGLSLIENNRDNPNFVIIDVRTRQEFQSGYISGSTNIDFSAYGFLTNLKQLDVEKSYLIYCQSGRRSGLALDAMRELGFSEVYNIGGGIIAWKAGGLPYLIR